MRLGTRFPPLVLRRTRYAYFCAQVPTSFPSTFHPHSRRYPLTHPPCFAPPTHPHQPPHAHPHSHPPVCSHAPAHSPLPTHMSLDPIGRPDAASELLDKFSWGQAFTEINREMPDIKRTHTHNHSLSHIHARTQTRIHNYPLILTHNTHPHPPTHTYI